MQQGRPVLSSPPRRRLVRSPFGMSASTTGIINVALTGERKERPARAGRGIRQATIPEGRQRTLLCVRARVFVRAYPFALRLPWPHVFPIASRRCLWFGSEEEAFGFVLALQRRAVQCLLLLYSSGQALARARNSTPDTASLSPARARTQTALDPRRPTGDVKIHGLAHTIKSPPVGGLLFLEFTRACTQPYHFLLRPSSVHCDSENVLCTTGLVAGNGISVPRLLIRCVMSYRVESFIEHQDTCTAGRARPDLSSPACAGGGGGVTAAPGSSSLHNQQAPASLSRTASSTSPSSDIVIGQPAAWPGPPAPMPSPTTATAFPHRFDQLAPSPPPPPEHRGGHNLELQLMPPSSSSGGACRVAPRSPAVSSQSHNDAAAATHLALSIGVGGGEATMASDEAWGEQQQLLRQAVAEKAAADEARAQARRHAELAEQELASAKRMRRQAQVELSRAHALRDHAVRQVNATLLQITCLSCRTKFRARLPPAAADVVCSYDVSSVVTEGGCDAEVHDRLVDAGLRRSQAAKLMDVL
ncbi:hypothetical protein PR202_gb22465 [Eleusine coracana subsp. coracana]|uniref:Uncharacterized protein n=1 Tax=Eleusine coracana subsp. coracana TaxID=191504 RepID=A0AAV5FDP2_ELECO|nr:hypothetical protein PR202_gb22465 [Eleusine coracana subsp. coracana]